jgi:2-keto-4-pentenoate hydratase/2-oxohepta-3-ene-1,7-dioic acid hydratase in catechol pathway
MQATPVALVRAALRAREIAARTNTPLIVTQNGEVIEKAVTSDMIFPVATPC